MKNIISALRPTQANPIKYNVDFILGSSVFKDYKN
jgi:hypothetical protein